MEDNDDDDDDKETVLEVNAEISERVVVC